MLLLVENICYQLQYNVSITYQYVVQHVGYSCQKSALLSRYFSLKRDVTNRVFNGMDV